MKLSINLTLLATIFLAGCQSMDGFGLARLGGGTVSEEQYVSTDQPQRLGREQFARGNYALAERYFQAAVERTPLDGDSWVGLAASYDQLGRFDLADRAYEQATKIKGNTPQLLNNRGYSYLLRGEALRANSLFRQALSSSPDNQTISNNIAILKRSQVAR
ncbi:tetratricopeptide repeat protein [Microvirga brassicacearum]|uniref:Tetratricopeptide repeat protein n=1 Tax=Microvirga brassicacearum TaxID=2580413 RepID=A0A5N3P7R3_9HYPH|nr:tetratricopeptide repeat protein [Microvirga brassicacearum]KAB0265767.1 tetratricopeptide repeat protein [Microvirga brassicacearum]